MKLPNDVLSKMMDAVDGRTWELSSSADGTYLPSEVRDDEIKDMQAAVDALCEAGYAVVPREPTPEMKEAGMEVSPLCIREQYPNGTFKGIIKSYSTEDCAQQFRAMLAAAEGESDE